jgi:hypothetical protein
MPHVIVKLWPGKSQSQKRRLARTIADDVMKVLKPTDAIIRLSASCHPQRVVPARACSASAGMRMVESGRVRSRPASVDRVDSVDVSRDTSRGDVRSLGSHSPGWE